MLRLSLLLLCFLFGTSGLTADEKAGQASAEKQSESQQPAGKRPEVRQRHTWAEIRIDGSLPENTQPPGLFGAPADSLPTILERLKQAGKDRGIRGVILHIGTLDGGFGRLHELRLGIAGVQATGKPVWARMEDAGNKEYLLASACDRILMPESGTLSLTGLRAEVTFYRGLFDLLSLQPDMLRVGAFKSAAEPYTRTEMSPEFREEMEAILDDQYGMLVEQIAERRKRTADEIRDAIDIGLISARRAVELQLVDKLAYQDEVPALIAEAAGAGISANEVRIMEDYRREKPSGELDLFSLMKLLSGPAETAGSTKPRIAVLTLEGSITAGADPTSLLTGGGGIDSDRIVPIIHKLAKDANVKAIVLRVDSPGGSALASDLIWRALESSGKPVVASMGDVAASGGYYISMGAERIFAEPGTVTGSIGVLGGKVAIEGLMKKVGVTTSVISRGKNSGVMSMTTGFSDSERDAMQGMLNETYVQFTTKAAAGRGMEVDKLEALARGRVYTGRQALAIGLVDQLGTLADAIAHARTLAGDTNGELELEQLPKAGSPLDSLLGQTQQAASPIVQLAEQLPEALRPAVRYLPVLDLMSREPVLLMMPFDLQF